MSSSVNEYLGGLFLDAALLCTPVWIILVEASAESPKLQATPVPAWLVVSLEVRVLKHRTHKEAC